MLLGITARADFFKKLTLYGQFIIDEFKADEVFGGQGWWANKWAGQIGASYIGKIQEVKHRLRIEYNGARPYMYSAKNALRNYAHYNQPLAHPLGANYHEFLIRDIGFYKRWSWMIHLSYAKQGSCLLYTSPSPRDLSTSRMPSSA